MVEIKINGLGSVKVDDSFKNMSPEDQQKVVDEIYNSTQLQRNTMDQPHPQGYFAETLGNVPESAMQFASDIAQPFLHPIETAKSLYDLGLGIVQLAIPGEQGSEDVARAVGAYLGQRYGGIENVKNTFREDPVGVLGDLSLILSGGGIAVKAASTAGQVGRIASAVGAAGRAIDPLTIASKAVSLPVKGASEVAKTVLGGATGVGRVPIDEALKAGREGQETLLQSMRGLIGEEETALKVSSAVDDMEAAVTKAYGDDLQKIAGAGQADINLVASNIKTFLDDFKLKTKNSSKLNMANDIESIVNKYLEDPTKYNIQGLDELKKDIDALRASDANEQLNRLVTKSRNMVKDEIINQFPEYKNIMEKYSKPLNEIKKIRQQLSINKFNLNTVSVMSKLQSSLKDLVGSSTRRSMIEKIDENLISEIAGQALSSAAPRGIPSSLAGLGVLVDPSFLLGIPATMPRVVGESAYKIGQAQRLGQQAGQAVSPVLSPIMTGARVTRPIQQPLEEQRQGLLNR